MEESRLIVLYIGVYLEGIVYTILDISYSYNQFEFNLVLSQAHDWKSCIKN